MVALGADEKKKLYILLGLAAVLGVVVVGVIKPFGRGGTTKTTVASSTPSPTPAGPTAQTVSTASTGAPSVSLPSTGAAPAGASATGTAQLIPLGRYRPNPFAPKVTPAGPPIPAPRATPRPLPPVSVPSPDFIAPATISGPEQGGPGSQSVGIPLGLPPVNIGQFTPLTQPRPSVSSGGAGGGAGGNTGSAVASNDKRLAGVVIGDSVRALIEINDGTQTITRVVKPGDEVDGTNIKILSIDRLTENGTTVTRMTVLENGQERYFDLRPASGQ